MSTTVTVQCYLNPSAIKYPSWPVLEQLEPFVGISCLGGVWAARGSEVVPVQVPAWLAWQGAAARGAVAWPCVCYGA